MTTNTQQAIVEIAQAIGENPDSIHAGQADWSELMRSGLIVKLHIRRWRGRTALSLDDIGVPTNGEQQLYDELLNLGQKVLMPRELIKELEAVDSGARKCLERHGFTTFWGVFVPASAYDAWKAENGKFEERYYALRDRLISDYDQIVGSLLDKYAEAARVAYKRRNKLQPGQDLDFRYLPEDGFVDSFMARIRTLIPSREEIEQSFSYEIDLTFIPLPSLLAEDAAEADRVTLTSLKNKTALQAEQERQAMITAMHREVLASAKAQKQAMIDGFLADIVRQLRSLIYDAVVQIGESFGRNGYLHPRSVVQIQTLIQKVSQLNFFGDAEADRMIGQLRAMAEQAGQTDGSQGDVTGQLRAIAVVTRQSLLALGDQPRSAKLLGVADAPSLSEVKQARQTLGLADVQPMTIKTAKTL